MTFRWQLCGGDERTVLRSLDGKAELMRFVARNIRAISVFQHRRDFLARPRCLSAGLGLVYHVTIAAPYPGESIRG